MKKLILFIVMFALVSFSITAFLIYKENNLSHQIEKNEASVSSGDKEINETEEKTLDLNARYNQNDLEILDDTLIYKDKEYEIVKISGLKNKDIENKINSDIKEKITKKFDEIYSKDLDESYEVGIYQNESANFSNVLSLKFYIDYKLNKEYENEWTTEFGLVTMNYELIDGNELMLEDLFVKDISLEDIVRQGMFNRLSEDVLGNDMGYYVSEVTYDQTKDSWMYEEYDVNTDDYVTKEYTLGYVEEANINYAMNEFMKQENKEFYFTHSQVHFIYQDNDYWLWLKDIADKVVIYDKYLTSENIYENENIGIKNILTCSAPSDYAISQEYKFELDNLFYDITAFENYYSYSNEGMSDFVKASYQTLNSKILNQAKDKLKEYISLAKENPSNMYLLFLQPQVLNLSDSSWNSDLDKWDYVYTKLMATTLDTKLITIENYDNKDEIVEKLYASYRYPNITFYGGVYDYCMNYEIFSGDNVKTYKDYAYNMYNAETSEEINSIDELFVDSFDYIEYMKNKLRENDYSEEELTSEIIFKPFTFYFKEGRYGVEEYIMTLLDFDESVLTIW